MPGLLSGKVGLIATLSERHGYPWGIAQACLREGATLAFAHQERYRRHVEELTADLPGALRFPLEFGEKSTDAQLHSGLEQLERAHGRLDFVIHTPAFAPFAALSGRVIETAREDFGRTMEISVHSLAALARATEPLLKRQGGSIIALTYFGGEKVVLGYKIMGVAKAALDALGRYLAAELGPDGIRVNLLSLSPQRTMAARGIPGFMDMYRLVEQQAPLRRNVETADAGNAAVFLVSDWGRYVTGEVLHVDAGYNTLGLWSPPAPATERSEAGSATPAATARPTIG